MGSGQSSQLKPDTQKILHDSQHNDLAFGVAAMKGWRNFMEDAHFALANFNGTDHHLFGIFDGHGGCQVALFVREEFPKQLKNNRNYRQKDYSEALHETFLKMDELISSDYGERRLQEIIEQQYAKDNCYNLGGDSVAGCTALVCLVTEDKIFVANSGDCKAIASINNICVLLTQDHRPTLQCEQDRIKQAGGQVRNGRIHGNINVSRCIGDFQFKSNKDLGRECQMIICDPDVKVFQRQNVNYILMGCDGIWETKTQIQMHQWITREQTDKISQKLSKLLDQEVSDSHKGLNGMDNMTAIMVRFD